MTEHTSAGFKGIKPNSSQVAFAGYDSESQTLRVEFNSGGAYHYRDVPVKEWEALKSAGSIGSHLHQHIKGRYSHERK